MEVSRCLPVVFKPRSRGPFGHISLYTSCFMKGKSDLKMESRKSKEINTNNIFCTCQNESTIVLVTLVSYLAYFCVIQRNKRCVLARVDPFSAPENIRNEHDWKIILKGLQILQTDQDVKGKMD